MNPLTWPSHIRIVRHGQSAGNVAREAAEAAGLFSIGVDLRDVDIPLSDLGERQARALGRWLFDHSSDEAPPDVVLASPYARAEHTARLIMDELHLEASKTRLILDERLREREFGAIEGLTRAGITDRFPLEAESYRKNGKFYYRPPGGESWCDVILRLRSFLDTLARDYKQRRVLIVCHTVVVLCLRYLFEQLSESEILTIDRENLVANCSLTTYRFDTNSDLSNHLSRDLFNFVVPLEEAGEQITRAPDVPKN